MEPSPFPAQLSLTIDLFSNIRLRQDFVATIVDILQVWTAVVRTAQIGEGAS